MDVLDWAKNYDGSKFHALLCDPPYELGFMGKDWDRSGIAFNPDKWLATLLLSPDIYSPRRILIPFAGVMSEAIAAMLAGWEEIVAIELSQEYCDIGQTRFGYWCSKPEQGKLSI